MVDTFPSVTVDVAELGTLVGTVHSEASDENEEPTEFTWVSSSMQMGGNGIPEGGGVDFFVDRRM